MRAVVLASESPRRRELLAELGVALSVQPAGINEVSILTDPAEVARDLALQKAQAVAATCPGAVVIAADTVVALAGAVLGKPRDTPQNAEFIRRLSGQTHRVCSGVAVLSPVGTSAEVACTDVTFRDLSAAEIAYYARSGEGQDKAGGYGIQGLGGALVARIEGEYSTVVGFPLSVVVRLLRAHGVAALGE